MMPKKKKEKMVEIHAVLLIPQRIHEHINNYARQLKTHPDIIHSEYVVRVAAEQIDREERLTAASFRCPEELLAELARLQEQRSRNWTTASIEAQPIEKRTPELAGS